MNILMLNYEFPPIGGGAGRAHYHLLKEYAKHADLQVDVLTARDVPEFAVEQFAPNVRLHRVGLHKKNLHYWTKREVIEWLFKARGHYRKLVAENAYDLVHAFFAFPSGWLCLKTAGKIPYVVSLRGSDVPGFNNRLKLDYVLLKGTFRRIWRGADAIVANSRGLAQLAQRFDPTLQYDVICNGIDTETFYPAAERRLSGRLKLLTVCRLIERKRIDLLIEALAELVRNGTDAELTIVGHGNLEAELKVLARALNLTDRVCFRGLVEYEHLASIYREHHIFLMSSLHEGMSNAMLEAMACGLPIVTTACEGSEELVSGNGVVVERPDARAIAQAVRGLLDKPDTRAQMARASRDKSLELSWENVAIRYIKTYHAICKK